MSDLEKDENKECCGGTMHDDPNHECCGGDCDHDHEHDIIVLVSDDGEEIKCQPLATFEFKEKVYLALLELGENELIFTEYEEIEEEFFLNPIVDDAEYEEVGNYYISLLDEIEEEE